MKLFLARFLWTGLILAGQSALHSAILTGGFNTLPAGTNINLTTLGARDWIHWGQFTEFAYDRKVVPTNLISDFNIAGNVLPTEGPFQRGDMSAGYTWEDGLQNSFVTNTTTGVYILGKNNGFRFTVPAGDTTNILRIYVASQSGGGSLLASLSDDSAGPFSHSSASIVEGYYTLTNAGGSAASVLTVNWVGSETSSVVVLQSAALAYLATNNPPSASLFVPDLNANLSASSIQTLQAIASDSDGTVSLVEFFTGTNKLGQTTVSPYTIDWTNPPTGLHSITVKATDNDGATYTSKAVDVFVYAAEGSLDGSSAVPPTNVSLSDEGTNDWAHWGYSDPTSFNHKANVVQQITNFTAIGANTVYQYADNLAAFSWTDGTPTVSALSSTTGVYVFGLTNGFEVALPASTQIRTVKFYVGLYAARVNFQAWLSDASAPAFTDTTLSSNYDNAYRVYTLSYKAASDDQALIIRHTALNSYDTVFGNVTLQAATLSLGNAPFASAIIITNVVSSTDSFGFSFATDLGANYQVLYTDSLLSTNWLLLTNFNGNGSMWTAVDPHTATNRFYRVYRQ
jgi:hypothetical protein